MIAMYTRRHSSSGQAAAHELQQGHLRGRILHSHSIWLELEGRSAADVGAIVGVVEEGFFGVVEMGEEDLFCEGEGSVWEEASDLAEVLEESGVGGCSAGYIAGDG